MSPSGMLLTHPDAGKVGKKMEDVFTPTEAANEVKKLAEQSSSSAADISSLIREVQSSTSRAVQAMNKGVLDVEKGSELIDAAGQVFNHVTSTFQEISDQIQEVSAASQGMSAGTCQKGIERSTNWLAFCFAQKSRKERERSYKVYKTRID